MAGKAATASGSLPAPGFSRHADADLLQTRTTPRGAVAAIGAMARFAGVDPIWHFQDAAPSQAPAAAERSAMSARRAISHHATAIQAIRSLHADAGAGKRADLRTIVLASQKGDAKSHAPRASRGRGAPHRHQAVGRAGWRDAMASSKRRILNIEHSLPV
jgi:hypothetical protein